MQCVFHSIFYKQYTSIRDISLDIISYDIFSMGYNIQKYRILLEMIFYNIHILSSGI